MGVMPAESVASWPLWAPTLQLHPHSHGWLRCLRSVDSENSAGWKLPQIGSAASCLLNLASKMGQRTLDSGATISAESRPLAEGAVSFSALPCLIYHDDEGVPGSDGHTRVCTWQVTEHRGTSSAPWYSRFQDPCSIATLSGPSRAGLNCWFDLFLEGKKKSLGTPENLPPLSKQTGSAPQLHLRLPFHSPSILPIPPFPRGTLLWRNRIKEGCLCVELSTFVSAGSYHPIPLAYFEPRRSLASI